MNTLLYYFIKLTHAAEPDATFGTSPADATMGTQSGGAVEFKSGLEATNIVDFAGKLANLAFVIIMSLAVLVVLYGAFQMMTSGGNPGKFEQGKKTVIYAAIGVAVATLSKVIVGLLYNLIISL